MNNREFKNRINNTESKSEQVQKDFANSFRNQANADRRRERNSLRKSPLAFSSKTHLLS